MRIACTLTLIAATAITTLAFAATANAQETALEVANETEGGHCNPCQIHVSGSSSLQAHSGGVEVAISACNDSFEGEIYEDGSGHFTTIAMTGANCNLVPCLGATGPPSQEEWPFFMGEATGESEHLLTDFCLLNSQAQPVHCEIEADIHEEESNNHHYILTVDDFTCPSGVEWTGSWETEWGACHPEDPQDAIELIHL